MQRRSFLLSPLALAALGGAACGGGGDDGDDPPPQRAIPVGTLAVTNHAAVTAADGSVVVIAGSRGANTLSAVVDRFDPATRRLARVATLAHAREGHRAVPLADGRILVVGGQASQGNAAVAELVHPLLGTVEAAGALVQTRQMHTATLLPDGRVLVTGGFARSTAELWDPLTKRWRLLDARLQLARAGHSATLLADGRVLVTGGQGGPTPGLAFAELWDPRTEAFTALADGGTLEPRMHHAAWRTADGGVLVVGGERPSDEAIEPLASALRFDPPSGRFTPAPPLGVARTLAAAVEGADGSALLVGGQTPGEAASPRLSRVGPAGGEQVLAALPAARVWHTASRLRDGRVLVVGGHDGAGRLVPEVLLLE